MDSDRKQIAIHLLLFFSVFFSYCYFYNGAAWNQNSRLNVIYSFVEPGTDDYLSFRINRFITDPIKGKNTGDWSKYGDNYYSNKAPGVALLGIPFYFGIYHTQNIIGLNPTEDVYALINAYFLNIILTVLPISISVLFFYRIAYSLGHKNNHSALLATISLYGGTLIFPYSTQLWGHVTATAFVIISMYYFISDLDAHAQRKKIAPRKKAKKKKKLSNSRLPLTLCGLFIGIAVLMEYSCLIILVTYIIAILTFNHRKFIIYFLAGCLIPFVLFAIYHKLCFGSYITLANFYINPLFQKGGQFGSLFSNNSLTALWGITFSSHRGLFFYMPFLVIMIPALLERKNVKYNLFFWMCITNIFLFVLMNITFKGWHGGTCFGPRYLIPVIPFMVLIIIETYFNRPYRFLTILLLVPSMLNMFVFTIISPMINEKILNPLPSYYNGFKLMLKDNIDVLHHWSFLPIRLQSEMTPIIKQLSAFNLGELMGLSQLYSLLPWLLLMIITGITIFRTLTQLGHRTESSP